MSYCYLIVTLWPDQTAEIRFGLYKSETADISIISTLPKFLHPEDGPQI